jgi:hypothetical protein
MVIFYNCFDSVVLFVCHFISLFEGIISFVCFPLMEIQFVPNCLMVIVATNVVNSHPANGEVYSILHYVIKFVSDLRQVGGFLHVLRFPPPIKLTAMVLLK